MPRYLSFEETLALLPYRRSYLYKLMHQARITYYKPTGGRAMFLESDIEEFIVRGKKSSSHELANQADALLNRSTIKTLKKGGSAIKK